MTRRLPFVMAALMLPLAALVEWANGRTLICPCGQVKLFAPQVLPGEDSQHLTDWYSFTHIVHGMLFFFLLWLVARRVSLSWRFAIAVAMEAGWEVFENSRFLIERYRTTTMSVDYHGDSILNSMSDILAAMLGFWVVSRLPGWAGFAVAVAIEIGLALIVRDNLTLNIVMLVWPVQAILTWQAAAH